MGRVRHPIYYSNRGEVKCGYRPKKGINIARRCVNGYSITSAPAKSVTHVSFWWCVYRAHSNGGEYATRQVACNSPSEGSRFRQSRQSRPEHPGVSDGNEGCCWCGCQLHYHAADSVLACEWTIMSQQIWNKIFITHAIHGKNRALGSGVCIYIYAGGIPSVSELSSSSDGIGGNSGRGGAGLGGGAPLP